MFCSFHLHQPYLRASTLGERHSSNIKDRLQLGDQFPLIHADVFTEELLQRVDALPRDVRVKCFLFFQMPAIHGLVRALDLDGDARLALLAHLNLLVVSLDRCSIGHVSSQCKWGWK